jgi:hypothetical protein
MIQLITVPLCAQHPTDNDALAVMFSARDNAYEHLWSQCDCDVVGV